MNHLQWIVSQDLSLTSSTSPDSRGIFLTSHLIFFKDIFTFLKEVRRKKNNEKNNVYYSITLSQKINIEESTMDAEMSLLGY